MTPAILVAIVAVAGLVMVFSGSGSGAASYKIFDAPNYGESYTIPGEEWQDEGATLGVDAANDCIDSGIEWTECCNVACTWLAGGHVERSSSCAYTCEQFGRAYATGR